MIRKFVASLIIVLGTAVIVPPVITSAQDAPRRGITVAPAMVDISVAKGASTTIPVSLRNNEAVPIAIRADLRGVDVAGRGQLVPSRDLDEELQALLRVTPSQTTLEPGQSINLMVTLTDSESLSPGGHYAALVIRQEDAVQSQSVGIQPAVSVPIFAVKSAGAIERVRADRIALNGSLLMPPSSATVTFTNTGNVVTMPAAVVQVMDWRGRLVRTGAVNSESLSVFPEKQLSLQAPLTAVNRAWIPGKYSVVVTYRVQGSDAVERSAATVFVVPVPFVIAVMAGLLVIGAVYVGARKLRRRPRKQLIQQAVQTPRPVRRSVDGIVGKKQPK